MPNDYFQFREFTIYQDKCAMKVCTDACILGAWAASQPRNEKISTRVLDIGTGTGLLSLMLAQCCQGPIDAVESDATAFSQASENIKRSPWKNRIKVFNERIQDFHTPNLYELIICNPPFYEKQLMSPDLAKNKAKHSTGLKIEELAGELSRHLSDTGSAYVLLPFERGEEFSLFLRNSGLYICKEMNIRQTSSHNYFRKLIMAGRHCKDKVSEEMYITETDGKYSEFFKSMLGPYYLSI